MNRRQISARAVTLLAVSVIALMVLTVGGTIHILRTELSQRFITDSAAQWAAVAATTLMERDAPAELKLNDADERLLLNALSSAGAIEYRILDAEGRVVRANPGETLGAMLDVDIAARIRADGTQAFLSDPIRNRPLRDGQAEAYAPLRQGEQLIGYVGIRLDRVEAGRDIFRFAEIGLVLFTLVMTAIGAPAVIALHRHLGARAALERDLQQRTDDLTRAERIANVGHWVLKRDTDIYDWSPEMFRIFGVDPATFSPTSAAVMGLYHPKDRELAVAAGLEAIRTGRTVRQDIRVQRPNGEIRHTENFIDCIFDAQGRGTGYFGVTRDVTERVLQEMELRGARDSLEAKAGQLTTMARDLEAANAEANRANAAKGDFLAMMSHELRTPMAGILGLADLLRLSGLTREQNEMADNLIVSAHSLLDLLNDILDFSKIEAGKIEIEHVHFSLHRLLMTAQRLFAPAIQEKGNRMTLTIGASCIDTVIGDPKRLNQVLANLISNANKFTERGDIHLDVDSLEQDGGLHRIEIRVRDSGIGMSPDEQRGLFRPFVQADSSTARRFGGTGLGLSICKRLVEIMNGAITVDSAKRRGSTFTVKLSLPAGDPAKAVERSLVAAPDLDGALKPARPLRILVAEDNDINRTLFQKMLTRLGHTVEVARDGRAAVALAEAGAFDIVLMDIQMPVMDGCQATAALRAKGGRFAALPIVGLTADAIPAHHETYINAGLNEIVTKPVDWSALAAVMARHVPGTDAAPIVPAAQTTTADIGAIDRRIIDDIVAALDVATAGELFGDFIVNMGRYVADIDAAVAAGDMRAMKIAAHTLTGLGGQFGAHEVAAVARQLEEEAPDLEHAKALTARLFGATARAEKESTRLLAELRAAA